MRKSLMIYISLGIVFALSIDVFIDYIGGMNLDKYKIERDYEDEPNDYHSLNEMGEFVLDVSGLEPKKQIEIWNNSKQKKEIIQEFPNFFNIKKYINSRVKGDYLKTRLLNQVNSISNQFISGTINSSRAKSMLNKIS